jgi:cytochrome P450
MTANPEIQAKAQDEIDRVIGSARLPALSDRENLPYIEAVMSEVLRCGTVAPQGAPHKARRSDIFQGYAIPEGSIIIPNSWCA